MKGFTLIELLIVVAILGILAIIVIPNVSGFLTTGNVAGANTEAANVETAALAYYAESNSWPTNTDQLNAFLSGRLKASYELVNGQIAGATSIDWSNITWSTEEESWIKIP